MEDMTLPVNPVNPMEDITFANPVNPMEDMTFVSPVNPMEDMTFVSPVNPMEDTVNLVLVRTAKNNYFSPCTN